MSVPKPAIVLYDGNCGVCDRTVQFILAHDPRGRFNFAAQQSAVGQSLLNAHQLDPAALDSVVLLGAGAPAVRSSAVLGILRRLGLPWALLTVGYLVPRPLRDGLYRWFARNRYRWFGAAPACRVIPPHLAQRFLDRG